VVGKPATKKDATNSGYVDPNSLHTWGLQA